MWVIAEYKRRERKYVVLTEEPYDDREDAIRDLRKYRTKYPKAIFRLLLSVVYPESEWLKGTNGPADTWYTEQKRIAAKEREEKKRKAAEAAKQSSRKRTTKKPR